MGPASPVIAAAPVATVCRVSDQAVLWMVAGAIMAVVGFGLIGGAIGYTVGGAGVGASIAGLGRALGWWNKR